MHSLPHTRTRTLLVAALAVSVSTTLAAPVAHAATPAGQRADKAPVSVFVPDAKRDVDVYPPKRKRYLAPTIRKSDIQSVSYTADSARQSFRVIYRVKAVHRDGRVKQTFSTDLVGRDSTGRRFEAFATTGVNPLPGNKFGTFTYTSGPATDCPGDVVRISRPATGPHTVTATMPYSCLFNQGVKVTRANVSSATVVSDGSSVAVWGSDGSKKVPLELR